MEVGRSDSDRFSGKSGGFGSEVQYADRTLQV
jgi:hypothetical protein